MGETGVTRGMRHPRSRQGGKPIHGFARAVWGGIGALAALLALPAPAAGLSLDWDRDARNGGTLPAWIVAVSTRELPPLESGRPDLVQLAAVTVPDKVLAELRGGFVTIGRVEIDIGFDFRTFINGALVVHNVLTPTGSGGGAAGGSSPSISPSATVVTLVSNGNSVTQVINDILDGGSSHSDNGNIPDVISNIVTSDGGGSHSGDGGALNVVTEITMNDGGVTQVINEINGGGVSTTIINTAGDLSISQINTTTIAVLNHTQFLSTVRIGRPLGGSPHMPLGLMGALIGVIAR